MTIRAGQYIQDGSVTWIVTDIRDNCPVGGVLLSISLRPSYVKANGATVAREDYPRLLRYAQENEIIGEKELFGEGDGTHTFVLPNFCGRFFEADNTAGTFKEAGLPNITGGWGGPIISNHSNYAKGAFHGASSQGAYGNGSNGDGVGIPLHTNRGDWGYGFDASRSSTIYGKSTTVQPASVTLIPLLKY